MVDGALVMLDLSQDFGIEEVGNYMTVIRREKLDSGNHVPVVNRGCMWQDSLENIYISGGHFFSQSLPAAWGYWDLSQFLYRRKTFQIIVSGNMIKIMNGLSYLPQLTHNTPPCEDWCHQAFHQLI